MTEALPKMSSHMEAATKGWTVQAALARAGAKGLDTGAVARELGLDDDPQSDRVRKAVGRTINALRATGLNIRNVTPIGSGQARYVLDPTDPRLALSLSDEDRAQLARVAQWIDERDAADILQPTPASSGSTPAAVWDRRKPAPAALDILVDALHTRSNVDFTYLSGTKKRDRTMAPLDLHATAGVAHVRGVDVALDPATDESAAVRVFRVDRIARAATLGLGSAAKYISRAPAAPLAVDPLRWVTPSGPVQATLACAPAHAATVRAALGRAPEYSETIDGDTCTVTVGSRNAEAVIGRVIELRTRVRILGPETFRQQVVAQLRAAREGGM